MDSKPVESTVRESRTDTFICIYIQTVESTFRESQINNVCIYTC